MIRPQFLLHCLSPWIVLAAVGLCAAQQPVVWHIDNLREINGIPVTVVGHPTVLDTEVGKAVHFAGSNTGGDALFLPSLPLTGALTYTWEVLFRPSSAGAEAQRFFHLQEDGSESRRLFELRIVGAKWCLDSFAVNTIPSQPAPNAVLLKCDASHLFPLDRWYTVAAVYDGTTLKSYVDGVLQAEAPVKLLPLGKGATSIGTRYNKRDFFTGDIALARFATRPLAVEDLLRVPSPSFSR